MKIIKMKRPKLNSCNLKLAIENMLNGVPGLYLTMSPGQWDNFLEEGYFRQGATLIEMDKRGQPVAAYKYVK